MFPAAVSSHRLECCGTLYSDTLCCCKTSTSSRVVATRSLGSLAAKIVLKGVLGKPFTQQVLSTDPWKSKE